MKKIAEGVFQLSLMPRNAINCYLVDDVLIDAGIRGSAPMILKEIKNRIITKHVLTHAHADHQGSTSVICKTLHIPLITSDGEKMNAESGKVTYDYPDKSHFIARFQQKYWAGEGHEVSATIREGDRVGSFVAIATPGHSADHFSFFREDDGLLIAGDVLVNMNLLTTRVGLRLPPGLFTTDKIKNLASVKKVADLNPKIICFGHGPVLRNNGELEKFIAGLDRPNG